MRRPGFDLDNAICSAWRLLCLPICPTSRGASLSAWSCLSAPAQDCSRSPLAILLVAPPSAEIGVRYASLVSCLPQGIRQGIQGHHKNRKRQRANTSVVGRRHPEVLRLRGRTFRFRPRAAGRYRLRRSALGLWPFAASVEQEALLVLHVCPPPRAMTAKDSTFQNLPSRRRTCHLVWLDNFDCSVVQCQGVVPPRMIAAMLLQVKVVQERSI